MKTPNEKLAELIVRRLEKENILDTKELEKLKSKIAQGSVGQDDWRVAMENSLARYQDTEQLP